MSQLSTVLVASAVILLAAILTGLVVFQHKIKQMGVLEFLGRLLRARGVRTVTARHLSAALAGNAPPLVIDVREPSKRERGLIPNALTIPFDDFLREVVVDGRFTEDKTREIVLVCDHGNVSRVAGDVLAEDEGFTQVSSVRGGMSAWYGLHRNRQHGPRPCRDAVSDTGH